LLIFSQDSIAQAFKDCDTAFNPCGESPFHFDDIAGIGTLDPDIDMTCAMVEINSTWIVWSVVEGGTLTFVITPDSEEQDIDFVVFKLLSGDDCDNKEVVRCMASGQNVGVPPEQWEICMGPTGLSVGETDTVEFAGCSPTDNNFLAPLETHAGDAYVMLVNDFTDTMMGFTLSFGGDALLDCITVPTFESNLSPDFAFEILPSYSSGLFFIQLSQEGLLGAQLAIYSMCGQPVYAESKMDQLSHQIDLTHMPGGAYTVVLSKEATISTQRLLIIK